MPSSSLVKVKVEVEVGDEVEVGFETTFSFGVAGENRIKAISSSKLKLRMSLAKTTTNRLCKDVSVDEAKPL